MNLFAINWLFNRKTQIRHLLCDNTYNNLLSDEDDNLALKTSTFGHYWAIR